MKQNHSVAIGAVLLINLIVMSQSGLMAAHAVDEEKLDAQSAAAKTAIATGDEGDQEKLINAAKKLFDEYKSAYLKYDFAGYDKFYSDKLKACIVVGKTSKAIDANTWRALSLKGRKQMQKQGLKSQFSTARYSAKGNYVRVRFNVKTLYELDTIDWLLEKGADGSLKILEERQAVTVTSK